MSQVTLRIRPSHVSSGSHSMVPSPVHTHIWLFTGVQTLLTSPDQPVAVIVVQVIDNQVPTVSHSIDQAESSRNIILSAFGSTRLAPVPPSARLTSVHPV